MGLFEKAFIRRIITKDTAVEDGGKGSGNFGHKGRPGLRGGSGAGGGKAYRAETKETASGYIGVQRAKSFRNMARNARANKDSFDNFIGSLSKEHISAIRDQMEACGTKENFEQYSKRMFDIMANYNAKAPSQARKAVEGQDIMTTYKRDPSYANEIDSIIHQQGFDGLPKIVSDKEFKEIVKANPEMPLMYRSYSGIDSEEVQDYDDMLENGKWYIDCGTGGAGHGQGMYCAAIYGDKTPRKIDGAMNEMKHYRKINEDRKSSGFDWTPYVTPGMKYKQTGDNKFREYDPNNVIDMSTNPPKPGDMFIANRYGSIASSMYGSRAWVLADDGKTVYRVDRDGAIDTYWPRQLSDFQDYCTLGEEKTVPKMKPVSASREMTLDPSAKIIKKADVEDEWKKHITAANKAAEKAVKAQAEEEYKKQDQQAIKDKRYEEILRDNLENPTDADVIDIYSAIQNQYGSWWQMPWSMRRMFNAYGNARSSTYTGNVKSLLKQTAWAYNVNKNQGRQIGVASWYGNDWQEFLKLPGVKEAYDGMLTRARAKADRNAKTVWINTYCKQNAKYPRVENVYDLGQMAAIMGYDAINAEGHGQTGSYTVVLNRTKVILNEQRVKVD